VEQAHAAWPGSVSTRCFRHALSSPQAANPSGKKGQIALILPIKWCVSNKKGIEGAPSWTSPSTRLHNIMHVRGLDDPGCRCPRRHGTRGDSKPRSTSLNPAPGPPRAQSRPAGLPADVVAPNRRREGRDDARIAGSLLSHGRAGGTNARLGRECRPAAIGPAD
jgi:hypothetical protein